MQQIQSDGRELPSMYDEKEFKKAGFRVNKAALVLTVAALLLIARFLNLGMWWLVTRAELSSKPLIPGVHYTFLNYSGSSEAAKKLAEIQMKNKIKAKTPPIFVAGYFNFVHPAVFLVHNTKGTLAPVDLGQVIVMAPPGTSSYSISLGGRITQTHGSQSNSADFDHSLLLPFTGLSQANQGSVSVTVKSPEKTAAVYIPYLIYFLLPLIAGLVLVNVYSQALFAAYLYFPVIFLLFDFQVLFCRVPFSWLIGISEKHGFSSPETWIALIIVGLLTAIGSFGLTRLKRRREVYKETLMVWFFPLLPLFLRF